MTTGTSTSRPYRAEGHLQPRLSRLTMVAMTFAVLNTWIALAGSIGLVLPSGGSISFLYGFIFCVACNFALAASLGELAAIWPTAGGQYHFVYALCTEKWRKPMSFWVGWTSIAGWLTLVTTEGFFAAQFISAAAVMASNNRYVIESWKTYLIFLAILTFTTGSNIWGNKILGRWNDAALYWSILAVAVISIVLLATSSKTDAEFVFTRFQNETGWPDGIAWILGLLQSALSLIGFDACLHMTEEMPNPSKDAPRAILYAVAVGGVTGTAFLIVILFCLTDPATIISTSTNMPICELIYQATGSRAAATVLTLMLAVCFINGNNGCITSASRLTYAMARDGGIVLPEFFSHISPTLNVPVRTILLCFVFNAAFGLLYLGPAVAFSAYAASCTIFLNVSYAFPVILLLIRGRGVLAEYQASSQGYFKMGRRTGAAVNWIAALFVVVTSVFFCFPTSLPVSSSVMNYVTAVIGIFLIAMSSFWMLFGRRFEGPKLEDIIVAQPVNEFAADTQHLSDTSNSNDYSKGKE
ncbi:amino acid/polyamine transporter I [Talaromyces proteolyticus]|uniref:Amino acid/polyamine transporter I n=1 Tax=Talaromyces proteolyticus TaxID=1131652 RepID=A0AAD4KMT9_9EURO|nr:amino acid/polyamine transporter I [Talaromyces proteolyticus]KAH8691560.1 amino acid/polyamine transporter I [Talaromyces proteolyticus]